MQLEVGQGTGPSLPGQAHEALKELSGDQGIPRSPVAGLILEGEEIGERAEGAGPGGGDQPAGQAHGAQPGAVQAHIASAAKLRSCIAAEYSTGTVIRSRFRSSSTRTILAA